MRWRVGLALLVVTACQAAPASRAEVTLSEFDIDTSAASFREGDVELDVVNSGSFGHTLVVTDSEGNVIDAGELIPPSGETSVELELGPGRYQLTCRIVGQDDEGNIVDHYQRGMAGTITVEGA
ncbi:MAG: hypothetical protein ACLFWM_04255 [Actinomycetota bacterium]